MARYNTKKVSTVAATATTTHQGGQGYQLKPELELMSLLYNGINNTFYEKESEQDKRLVELINIVGKKDKMLVAKMLIYTRAKVGQRSVTHRGAVAFAPLISGEEWGKYFFSKRSRQGNEGGIVYRLDDMLEIAACYTVTNPSPNKRKNGQPTLRLPAAMKRGFKAALEQADEYELAKYQGGGRSMSLVNLVNMVRPVPSEKMEPVFKKLMSGELKQFNTVEDKNTKAGQEIAAKVKAGDLDKDEAAEALTKAKEANFKTLISEDKVIGYLVLLRNLRNIIKNSSDKQLIQDTITQLTDEKAIRKSLVFPHQIDLALEELLSDGIDARQFVTALNKAYELAIPNLSELNATGRTVVVYDASGSMTTKIHIKQGKYGSQGAIEKAALIAATLAKGLNADVYTFGDSCKEINYNPNDSINTLKNNFNKANMGGTYWSSIFPALKNRYDRIFIISDEQGADSVGNTLTNYKKQYGVDPYVYCINLCGYGTTMMKPGNKIFQLFGYSAELYEIVRKQETDFNAVLNEVQKINFIPSKKENSKKFVKA